MKERKELFTPDGNRPIQQEFPQKKHIDDYPTGPSFTAGYLAQNNAGWRVFRPQLDMTKCVGCFQCYMVCPDGVIFKTTNKESGKATVDFDFNYCKGCGICANECPTKAIEMVQERRG